MTSTMRPAASAAVRAALKGYEPSPEQWNAIAHPLEPLYLVAGAGAGKTAVMAARIVWILEQNDLLASQVLGLTFTNKAAEELAERVRSALAVRSQAEGREIVYTDGDVAIFTYNAFAASVVRDHGLLVDVEPEAGLLSEAQQWQLVLSSLDDLPAFDAIELRSPAWLVKATLGLADSLANHIVGVADVEAAADRVIASNDALNSDVEETARKRKELCRVVEAYQRAKQRSARIDFGDQVTKAVEIFEAHPDVRDIFRERFPVVLLDEYQDTNVAQRRLIKQLVEPGGAVTAVGDTRQAIFAFRGATMYNLINFPKDFPRADGKPYTELSLSENFRSGSKILAVANDIVGRIDPERRPGAALVAHEANGIGRVLGGLFTDEHAEAQWIARRCEQLHGVALAEGREPVGWRDIAILVRRKAAMDAILEALEEFRIPVEVVGLGGLLKTPEVTEIVAWLRCLDTRPAANRWLARILLGPRWRVHYRDLALCARWASEQNRDLRLHLAGGDEERARDMEPGDVAFSLLEAIGHVDEIDGLGDDARDRIKGFGRRLALLQIKIGAPLLELVQEVIAVSGIGDALDASTSRAAPAAKQNVANFLDQVAAFAPIEGEATHRSFLTYLDAADAAEETLEATQPAEQDSVKLMTVHSAKGLEFECVFVPSVTSSKNRKGDYVYSIFPNTRASNPLTSYTELPYEVREDNKYLPRWTGKLRDFEAAVKERALEDERRLFYVALTRARQHLSVTASWWYGRDKMQRGPSLFWDETAALADDGLVEIVERAEAPDDNPVYAGLEARRTWPPPPRSGMEDSVFPEGWGAVADALVAGEVSLNELLERLGEADRARVDEIIAANESELEQIAAADHYRGDALPQLPGILSATSMVRLAEGKMDVWDLVRPLPERPTSSRRLGTELHRLIEEQSRGLSPYPGEDELDEPSAPTDLRGLSRQLGHYRDLGYSERRIARLPSGEPMVELPFAMRWNGRIVRGRIDAVYETDDGGLEIVDYKSGRRFEPAAHDQLDIYARALRANGLLSPGLSVTLTYAFLDGEDPVSRGWQPDDD
jgi:DNA helicase II / ATP-dependent DNA helicase PcrA